MFLFRGKDNVEIVLTNSNVDFNNWYGEDVVHWFASFFDSRQPSLVMKQFGGTPNYNLHTSEWTSNSEFGGTPRAFWGTSVENH